jgi:hypothetical protein
MTPGAWARACVALVALVVTLLVSVECRAAPRRALLVGSSTGTAEQATLRYTREDVQRVSRVLTELGGVEAANVTTVQDVPAARVLAALDALAADPNAKSEVFVFYYSGHGDASGLTLGATTLDLTVLLAKVALVPAALRVVVIDACQSGSAIRAKGVTIGPPIAVRIDTNDSSGLVVMSSSTAGEESFETDTSKAAVFSLHLTTGLRGAADGDGDGLVTLSEAYRYAYAQTLRATMLSAAGTQHPMFRWDLAGQREPVLTRLAASARVQLKASDDGDFILFDGDERRVVAEVRVEHGHTVQLSMTPGAYVVRKRSPRALRSAKIVLARGDDRVLDEEQMPGTPLVRLAKKGGLGAMSITAAAGQFWSGFGQQGHVQVAAGPEWERGYWLLGGQGTFGGGTQENHGLTTRERWLGLTASALVGFRIGNVSLRGGPALGVHAISQSPESAPSRWSGAVRTGARLRIDVELTSNMSLLVVGDPQIALAPVDRVDRGVVGLASWGATPWLGYTAGIVALW